MAKKVMKGLDEMKKEFLDSMPEEMQKQNDEMEELRKENFSLKKTLEVHGIKEHSILTEVEYICSKGIGDLRRLVNTIGLNESDVKSLDILHKNLRSARGTLDRKEIENQDESIDELLKIVAGGKK